MRISPLNRKLLRDLLAMKGQAFAIAMVVAAGVAMNVMYLSTFESLPKPRRRDPDSLAEAVRRAVRAAIAQRWRKKPICHVHVLTV